MITHLRRTKVIKKTGKSKKKLHRISFFVRILSTHEVNLSFCSLIETSGVQAPADIQKLFLSFKAVIDKKFIQAW